MEVAGRKIKSLMAIALFAFYAFSRLWMVVKYGDAGFGYDFGI